MWDPHKTRGQQRTTAKKCNWVIPRTQMGCVVQSLSHANSLRPHELQHARLLCPSLSPGVFSNSCPLSWWCYLTISFSAAPFTFYLKSFPESRSFPMSQFFTSSGRSIRASVSASVLALGLISFRIDGLVSLLLRGLSRVFSSTTVQKHQFFSTQPFL